MATNPGKPESLLQSIPLEEILGDRGIDPYDGSADDRLNMYRMGKSQEFQRNFRLLSIFGFSMILMCSWQTLLTMSYFGLVDGGTGGLIWMSFICWIGLTLVNTSLAELGSMAPTSGGQYHWVSELAPRKHQKFLSYLIGWLCVLGWQATAASAAFLVGTQIQGLIVLNSPSYVFEAWHGTLLSIAVSGFSILFNIVLAKELPVVEGIVLVIHVFSWCGILVTLWVVSPMADAKTVFTTFSDNGDWGSVGASTLVGITAGLLPLLGVDAAVHMSEEVQDASRSIPQAMIWTTAVNGAMAWVMIITFCFSAATMDLEQILGSATGYPFMAVFANATNSAASATAMTVWMVIIGVFANLSVVATASRQLFAFARDSGVPFSPHFSKVSPKWNLPLNSISITFVVSALLSLINLGSSTALNSITSLTVCASISSYMVSIGCNIWRRATGQVLLPSKFNLGKWGLPINIAAEIFLVIAFVLSFFPISRNPDAEAMNWNILIYGVVVVMSLIYYVLRGRHRYAGPVEYVRKLE